MFDHDTAASTRSLTSVQLNEHVNVAAFLFDAVREYCDALGLHQGDELIRRNTSPSILIFALPDGRTMSLERGLARFVAVTSANGTAATGRVN